jgi:hypothetical protein
MATKGAPVLGLMRLPTMATYLAMVLLEYVVVNEPDSDLMADMSGLRTVL